jgi:TPR repeat protein
MSALSRSVVVGLLLGSFTIFSARVQADPKGLEIGRPGEMYALGVMHDEGVGVGVDERRAYEWYIRAAKRGHAESMNRLGILCLRGRGVPLNATASLAWFRLAAAKGSLTAMNNIALLYFYGFGVRQSYSQAAKLLRMSADKGDPDALNKLAGMYDDGLGVARDARRAKALYLKSAAQGYSPAMVNLGRMLVRAGSGESRDVFAYPISAQSNASSASIGVERALLIAPDSLSGQSTAVAFGDDARVPRKLP